MPLPLIPLVMAGAEVAGQVTNAISQGSMNKKTREWNEKMYGQQRSDALADWQMQNAYNTPAAQMQRLKEAGLNPNLIYGNGSAGGQSGPVRSTDVKGWNPQAPQFQPADVLGKYYDAQVRQQQLDNLKTQQTLMEQEVKNKVASELKTYNDAEKSQSSRDLIDTMVQLRGNELTYAPEMSATTLAAKKAGIEKTIQDTRLSQANTAFRLSENDRAQIRLDMTLKEAASRILLNRANQLRAEAQTTTEYYRKQELMNQAQLLEKKISTESYNQQIKSEEVRLKQATPGYYEKAFIESVSNIVKGATSRSFSNGSRGSDTYSGKWTQPYKYDKDTKNYRSWYGDNDVFNSNQ